MGTENGLDSIYDNSGAQRNDFGLNESVSDLIEKGLLKISAPKVEKIREFETTLEDNNAIPYWASRHTEGTSLRALSRESGLAPSIITASPKPRTLSPGMRAKLGYSLPRTLSSEADVNLELRKPRTFSPRKFIRNVLVAAGVSIRTQKDAVRQTLADLQNDQEFRQKQLNGLRLKSQDRDFVKRRNQAVREALAVKRASDPEYVRRRSEISRRTLARLKQDPEFRRKSAEAARQTLSRLWNTEEFRAKNAESFSQLRQDEGFRERQANASRQALARLRQDPEFRIKISKAVSNATRQRWQDDGVSTKQGEGFKKRVSDRIRQLWLDSNFRERNARAVRLARLSPDRMHRYYLPTISGERYDVGYAQSCWEANFARILYFVDRDFYQHERMDLLVTEEYQTLFNAETTALDLDFVTQRRNGQIVIYEIMAHPKEDPEGWAKLQMLMEQYPSIRIKLITSRLYRRLESFFAERINQDVRFSGWETRQDNLRKNPANYGI